MYFLHIYRLGLEGSFLKLCKVWITMTIHTTIFNASNSLSNHQKSYTSRCLRKTTVNPPGGLLCSQMTVKTEEIARALGAGYKK